MAESSEQPLKIERADRDASDGWFSSMAVTVRNVSSKPIVFAEYTLVFADVHADGATMTLRFRYGNEDLLNGGKPGGDAKALEPSKTTRLKLVNDKWSMKAGRMKDVGTPYNGAAVLSLSTVCFADGSRWGGGQVAAR